MVMEGDLTWGGEHTIQYADDVLQNYIHETYIILLTNVTPINSKIYPEFLDNFWSVQKESSHC